VPRHIARHAGVTQETGVRVMKVIDKSPADEAGIKSGDLIIAIDGQSVAGVDDLLRLLDHGRVGHETRIGVLRRGELRERFIVPVERR
jgi:S1-C subfamily serine protease